MAKDKKPKTEEVKVEERELEVHWETCDNGCCLRVVVTRGKDSQVTALDAVVALEGTVQMFRTNFKPEQRLHDREDKKETPLVPEPGGDRGLH